MVVIEFYQQMFLFFNNWDVGETNQSSEMGEHNEDNEPVWPSNSSCGLDLPPVTTSNHHHQ